MRSNRLANPQTSSASIEPGKMRTSNVCLASNPAAMLRKLKSQYLVGLQARSIWRASSQLAFRKASSLASSIRFVAIGPRRIQFRFVPTCARTPPTTSTKKWAVSARSILHVASPMLHRPLFYKTLRKCAHNVHIHIRGSCG